MFPGMKDATSLQWVARCCAKHMGEKGDALMKPAADLHRTPRCCAKHTHVLACDALKHGAERISQPLWRQQALCASSDVD